MASSNIPAFNMSIILILFVPKMMAFGGVATGNINAIEAASVAGIISNMGLIFIATASPASIGNIISVVATFDVSSVKSASMVTTIKVRIIGFTPASPFNSSPNQTESPESTNHCASAKPPPKSSTIPHGILFAVSQFISFSPFCVFEGIINNNSENNIATVPSLM